MCAQNKTKHSAVIFGFTNCTCKKKSYVDSENVCTIKDYCGVNTPKTFKKFDFFGQGITVRTFSVRVKNKYNENSAKIITF